MLAGLLYDPSDPELAALRQRAHVLSKRYNDTDETREAERRAILQELLPDCGESVYLQGPVQFDYGCFTSFGACSYANFIRCAGRTATSTERRTAP